jgi:hypothetical protein
MYGATDRDEPVRGQQGSEAGQFIDRRRQSGSQGSSERRQFGSSHENLSDDGRELALAIDRYKLQHHRRYITCDEMLMVISSLGYSK